MNSTRYHRALHRLGLPLSMLTALAALGGCAAGGDVDDEDVGAGEQALDLQRVVIARAYQHEDWTLPPLDTSGDGVPDVVRDPAYVCAAIAALQPTYVSGLVRLEGRHQDGDGNTVPAEKLTQKQIDDYNAIRDCIRHDVANTVRFNVVLNADQYQTASEFTSQLSAVNAALHPDGWYFDFFETADSHYPQALAAAIDWARQHGQFVGGTIWGTEVPHGASFVAVDDSLPKDSQATDGFERMRSEVAQIHAEKPNLPVLFHMENNPGKKGNRGEKWMFDWGTAQRKDVLKKHVSHQGDVGYTYMFPVVFPISKRRDGAYAQFPGNSYVAYDAASDGDMLATMQQLIGVSHAPPPPTGTVSGPVAFQANTGNLWTTSTAGPRDWGLGMMGGTSPAVAKMAGGQFAVAFQANTGNLWVVTSNGTGGDTGLGMAPGTNPAITPLGNGSYQVAFQANTGNLWTTGAAGTADLGLGMAGGTSPAISAIGNKGYEVAFQANTSRLWTAGSAGTRDWQLGMAAGTSPSIATLDDGTYAVVFQANTANLWLLTSRMSTAKDLGLGMMPGTSPSIAPLYGSGFQIAFQANTANLWTTGTLGLADLGLGMMPGTSPSITVAGSSYEILFQANTANLWSVDKGKAGDLGFGMATSTSPSGS